MKYIVIYLLLINIIAFSMMGIDKRKARMHKWRISEANLFLSALLGGGLGATAGMWFFHHKTKHWYFVVGMPLILVLEGAGLIWFFAK